MNTWCIRLYVNILTTTRQNFPLPKLNNFLRQSDFHSLRWNSLKKRILTQLCQGKYLFRKRTYVTRFLLTEALLYRLKRHEPPAIGADRLSVQLSQEKIVYLLNLCNLLIQGSSKKEVEDLKQLWLVKRSGSFLPAIKRFQSHSACSFCSIT